MREKTSILRRLLVGVSLVLAAGLAQAYTLHKGELLVGSDTKFPPFEMRALSGQNVDGYTGFDVELVAACAKQMGLKLKILPMNFDGLIPAVQTKRIDMIMSAMTITKARAKSVAFTDPYINADLSILSRTADGKLDTAKLKGKRIGGEIGTTGLAKAKSIAGTAAVVTYQTTLDAINDLLAKRIYAVINDEPVNAYVAKRNHRLTTGEVFRTGDQYGFAFNLSNTALRARFDKALKQVKADGSYTRIFKKWFGHAPRSIP